MKKAILLSIFVLMTAISLFAQEPPKAGREQEVEGVIRSMMTAYEQLPNNKNKDSFLNFFDKDYKLDRVRISMDERVESQVNDVFDLDKLLVLVTQTPNMSIHYNITKFLTTYATDNVAYSIFDAVYDVQRDNKPYVVGHEVVTFFLKKMEGKWKVVRGHSIQVRDKVNRAACSCNIFKSDADANSYIVQTEVPEGEAFAKKLNTFTFETLQNGFRTINVDGQRFSWDKDGVIALIPSGAGDIRNNQEKSVGTAKKPGEAIVTILKDHLYLNNCSAIKLLK